MDPSYIDMGALYGPAAEEAAKRTGKVMDEILESDLGLIALALIGLAIILVPLYFFAAGTATAPRRNEPEPRHEPPIDLTPTRSPAPVSAPVAAPAAAAPAAPEPAPDADAIAAAEAEAAAAALEQQPTQEELDALAEAQRVLDEGGEIQ